MRSRILLVLAIAVGALSFATTASAAWTRLGGDPLVPGGVNSRAQFVRVMTSTKGNTAMAFAGLNKAERNAVVGQVRRGNFSFCTMKFGQKFWRMSFGINGTSVDRNVTFRDPRFRRGAPAWCVTAVSKNGMEVSVMMPRKCGNVAVPRPPVRKIRRVVVKHPTPVVVPPAPLPPGSCNAVNSPGSVLCSSFTVTVTCGVSQIVINGSTAAEAQANAAAWLKNNCNTTTIIPPPPPPPPPPVTQSVTITSIIVLNDVPSGLTSGPMPVSVNASAAGGSLTVDPGIGGVSDCNSSTPLPGALTFNNLPAGNSTQCVIYYAPLDASATQDTITYTAILGTAKDVRTTTFAITHPVRP